MNDRPRAPSRTWQVLLAFAAALLGAVGAPPTSSAANAGSVLDDVSGLYVATQPLINRRRAPSDAVYGSPAGGIYIRLVWGTIEPSPGRYDWSTLDHELDRALRSGKKISVSVITGGFSPGWLSREGISTSDFTVGKGGFRRRHCVTSRIAWPWDPEYQSAYVRMMTALARHLRSRPGAYEAVRIVKITGISQNTEEMRLPSTDGQPRLRGGYPDACVPSDAIATWQEAGYRPSLVLQAWNAMAEGVAKAFPDKLLAQDILDQGDFPPIGEDRRVGGRPTVKNEIIRSGLDRFRGRFAVQWNGLKAEGRTSLVVLEAGRQGAVVGWQTNAYDGHDGAGCDAARSPNPTPCDAPSYQQILDRGLAQGAHYIEIWPADALDFPGVVSAIEADFSRSRGARNGGAR